MKWFTLLFLCIGLLQAESMSVQVKEAMVKSKPSFLSKTLETLRYGDKVEASDAEGDWTKVKSKKGSGWLHLSSLTTKEIVLKNSGKTGHGASNSEVVMAGKGFSKEVEDSYKKTNRDLNYRDVDLVEKSRPTLSSVTKFADAGKLSLK